MSEEPIKIFYSYSRKDQTLREKLDQHLAPLRFAGLISTWYDLLLAPGSHWQQDIGDRLNTADIILLLVSDNFLSSEYCYSIELKRALEQEARKETCVIPIILEPCDWKHQWVPFSNLTALPNHEKAITEWDNQNAAFTSVVQSIRLKVNQLNAKKLAEQQVEEEQRQQLLAQQEAEKRAEQERIHQEKRQGEQRNQPTQKVIGEDLQEFDPAKILFIKNVKNPTGWAYLLDQTQQPENRTFELMWRLGSHGSQTPLAGDLMILHQRAKVTHIVKFLSNEVRKTDTGLFREVKAVWMPEQDWYSLPHQKDILGFSPNYADGNTHSLKSPNFSTFREAWNSLEAFQKHIIKRLVQSDAIITDESNLTSEKGIDYTKLRDLLQANQWKEADRETHLRMLEAVGRKDGDWIRAEELRNFPCADLQTIDRLWVKHSNGHFGFSVQKQIWQECGRPTSSGKDWDHFCVEVGWQNFTARAYVPYSDLKFDPKNSPVGELPWVWWVLGAEWEEGFVGCLFSRAETCRF